MQEELRTKDSKVLHPELLCAPLLISFWTLPSSETAAGFSPSAQQQYLRPDTVSAGFLPAGEGCISNLSVVFRNHTLCSWWWLRQFVEGAECSATSQTATADLPCRKVHADTSRSWPGAAPPHCFAETGYVPVPDSFKLAAFSWGVTSVQMCRSSIICAHVYQCCPETTLQPQQLKKQKYSAAGKELEVKHQQK